MKKYPTGALLLAVGIGSLLFCTYKLCKPVITREIMRRDACQFRDSLAKMLQDADCVTVVEHSHSWDLGEPQAKSGYLVVLEEQPEFEYSRVILNADQKNALVTAIARVAPEPKRTWSPSIFRPHHTFEVTKAGIITDRVYVSFTEHRLEWYRASGDKFVSIDGLEPDGLNSALESFIVSLGLRAHADWEDICRTKRGCQPP